MAFSSDKVLTVLNGGNGWEHQRPAGGEVDVPIWQQIHRAKHDRAERSRIFVLVSTNTLQISSYKP